MVNYFLIIINNDSNENHKQFQRVELNHIFLPDTEKVDGDVDGVVVVGGVENKLGG